MSHLHFPEEVLQHIFSYLIPDIREPYWGSCSPAHDSIYKTLAAVCLANKACYRIAQQYLYHTLEVYGVPHCRQSKHEVSGRPSNLRHLVIHLLRNPKLALEVRRIKIESWRSESYESREEEPRLQEVGGPCDMGPELHELGRQKLREANISALVAFNVRDAVCKGREDGQLALLLTICPYLEELELSVVHEMYKTRVTAIVEDCMDLLSFSAEGDRAAAFHSRGSSPRSTKNRSSLPFSNLRTLSLRNCSPAYEDSSIHLDQVVSFLAAPNLQTFRTYGLHYTPFCPYPPQPSALRHLRIDATEISAYALCAALQANFNITILELHNICTSVTSWSAGGSLATLGDALRTSGQNLETLVVQPREQNYMNTYNHLGDISTLTNLKHIRVDCSNFLINTSDVDPRLSDNISSPSSNPRRVLVEDLPLSIESLEITSCDTQGAMTGYPIEEHLFQRLDYGLMLLLRDPRFSELRRVVVERMQLRGYAQNLGEWNEWVGKGDVEGGWVVFERRTG